MKKFDLNSFDYVYLIRDYKKNTRSSVEHPEVAAVLSSFMPAGYKIERNEQGRPYAVSNMGRAVGFSLSHSRDMLLLAVSKEQNIGIDIEFLKERPWRERIAERYFVPKQSLERFYQCFVAAESLRKASEFSLSQSLRLVGRVENDDWHIGGYKIEFGQMAEGYMFGICRSLKNERALVYFAS